MLSKNLIQSIWAKKSLDHRVCTLTRFHKDLNCSSLKRCIGMRFPCPNTITCKGTLRSQIEGYTRLLIFRKFSTLPAVIWASPFINFQENFQPPCFFTYTNEKNSTLPTVIRAYPLIRFEEKFQSPLLLEHPLVLET